MHPYNASLLTLPHLDLNLAPPPPVVCMVLNILAQYPFTCFQAQQQPHLGLAHAATCFVWLTALNQYPFVCFQAGDAHRQLYLDLNHAPTLDLYSVNYIDPVSLDVSRPRWYAPCCSYRSPALIWCSGTAITNSNITIVPFFYLFSSFFFKKKACKQNVDLRCV